MEAKRLREQHREYLCKIQLQLFPVEVRVVELYACSRGRFGFAEIYSDSSKAFKQLKRHLVVIDSEKCFKSLLKIEERQGRGGGGWGKKENL